MGIYDNQDRLLSYANCSYSYSANGELQNKTCGAEVTQYRYDLLGNLVAVTLPDGTELQYLIDGQDCRIGKKVNGNVVQGFFIQDQLSLVAELNADDTCPLNILMPALGPLSHS